MLFEGKLLPRWLGGLMHSIGVPLVHAGVPWLLSLGAVRHGWTADKPGAYNLLGLFPVWIGFCALAWCIRVHFTAAPSGWRIETTPHYPTPAYLLMKGPYRFSRNPIYLAEGAIWLGWIVFYGSVAVLAVLCLAAFFGPLIVRREERGLETRFGEMWRVYKRATPRWLV